MLCRADISPKTVYITPLCRTRQTAEVLFPGRKARRNRWAEGDVLWQL